MNRAEVRTAACLLLLLSAGCTGAHRRLPDSRLQEVEAPLLRPLAGGSKIYVLMDLPLGVEGVFLLDTGSSTTLLTPETAESLELEVEETDGQLMGLGGVIPLMTAELDWISLQGMAVEDLSVAVADTSLPHFSSAVPMAGILGMDFLSQFQIAIDYPRDRIQLARPGTWLLDEALSAPMSYQDGHLKVRVELLAEGAEDDVLVTMDLDTGARGVLLDERSMRALSKTRELAPSVGEELILGVGAKAGMPLSSFYRETYHIPLEQVRIGEMVLAKGAQAVGLRERPYVPRLIGHELLSDHRVLLDVPGERIQFLPSESKAPQSGHQILLELDQLRHRRAPERALYRARLMAALGENEQALEQLEQLERMRPEDREQALILQARLALATGDARAYLARVEQIPLEVLIRREEWVAAANAIALEGGAEGVLARAQQATDIAPGDPSAWLALSDVLLLHGLHEEASAAMRRYLELAGNPDAQLIRRARLQWAQGEVAGPLTLLRRQMALYPDDGVALWFYGLLLAELSDEDLLMTAQSDLLEGLERLHPLNRPLDFASGVQARWGEPKQSQLLAQEGLQRDCLALPDNGAKQNCEAWYLGLQGVELDQALSLVEEALSLHPPRPDFLDTQALIHWGMGQLDDAIRAAKEAHALQPGAIYYLWQLEQLQRRRPT